ncbi:MAG TPA: 4-alpha-glucanotransferase, partial [Spirochaetales bacterium]|nr:4-alpha-glucanotransferase [Spirochaetales bacterium]
MHRRSSGILLHITSLPGSPGIGTIGKPAHRFIDALKRAGQTLWQILPLGPTGYGDSPYAPFSSFAGNEILIDCHELAEAGLLPDSSLSALDSLPSHTVDYWAVKQTVLPLLTRAAERFLELHPDDTAYQTFKEQQCYWLDDYTVFRSIKNYHDEKAQQEGAVSTWNTYWPIELRQHTSKAVLEWKKDHAHEIEVLKVIQFFFFSQWAKLKRYAKEQGIAIIGDIPIFVALDSADVWSHPELFNLDKNFAPITVAGVPPDYFSETGQLWGNPVYCWDEMEKTEFRWWVDRLEHNLILFDILRLDHFRGFVAYWEVPGTEKTAIGG